MIIDSHSIKVFLPEDIFQIADIDDFSVNEKKSSMKNTFNSEYFIITLISSFNNVELEENKKILNRLCKKVDVQKKVVKLYSKDLSQIVDDTTIKRELLILLMIIYLYLSQKDKNIKFLNTVLKILDGTIEPEFNYPKFLSIWADSLIEELI